MDDNVLKSGIEPVVPNPVVPPAVAADAERPISNDAASLAIRGRLDELTGAFVTGWAQDAARPEKRLGVELLDDDKVIAAGEADRLRTDLRDAGIGDGKYGFRIPLPSAVADGKEHVLTVRVAGLGIPLAGEERIRINYVGAVTGIEGTDITGWVIDRTAPGSHLEINVYEDDNVLADGIADLDCAHGKCGFRIPLPPDCLDGLSHTFVVREKNTGFLIGEMEAVTPVFLSKGPLLSCEVAGVAEGHAFGWMRLAGSCDPSGLDIATEAGEAGGPVRFGKAAGGTKVAPVKTVSFVTKIGNDKTLPENFILRDRKTSRVVGTRPIPLRSGSGWGHVDRIEGIYCTGWALTGGGHMARAELLVDGVPSSTAPAIIVRSELSQWGLPHVNFGFRLQLPETALDGQKHEISVRVAGSPEFLAGSKRRFRYDPKFHIDSASRSHLRGWIFNRDSDDAPVQLDARVGGVTVGSGGSGLTREDVYKIHGYRYVGFDIHLDREKLGRQNSQDIKLFFAGTNIPALPVTIAMVSADRLVNAIQDMTSSLNGSERGLQIAADGHLPAARAYELVRRQLMPKLISEIRAAMREGKTVWTVNSYDDPHIAGRPVDVIVPVYKGYKETIACIESVLVARCDKGYELVVINDSSPDPALTKALRALAEEKSFTLIENEDNLGFVATVNRGMALHEGEGRDVVLLNSDTVVPPGWLDGLYAAAYSASNIGTVTPFSNRATICSIPRPQYDNDLVDDNDCRSMNDICARVNGGEVIDIPTAVGYCMYIRRATLREVGLFDEGIWKKGYGEENDFCMKARGLGWRNVAATGIFVQHHGSVSFAEEKDERVKENLAVLNGLYPDYTAVIQRFVKDDPLAASRARVNLELLRRRASGYVLHIAHSWGGGTERAIRDLAERLADEGVSSLVMEPAPDDTVVFSSVDDRIPVSISLKNDLAPLVNALREIGVFHIHVHQMIGYPARLWDLPERLGVPYDVSIHDYFFICPRVQLIDDTGIFCGQPEVGICESCCRAKPLGEEIENTFSDMGKSVAGWRKFYEERLTAARMVIAPSNDARQRIQRYYNLDNIVTLPHPESGRIGQLRVSGGGEITVAVIGAIGPHKGSDILLRCAGYAKANRVPVSFVIIGYTNMDDKFRGLDNVVITGKYRPDDLPKLIDACGCTVALFLSICPETYSYTLSEALVNGLFPIAFDLGALPERIAGCGRGQVLPMTATVEEIIAAIISRDGAGDAQAANEQRCYREYKSIVKEYYAL